MKTVILFSGIVSIVSAHTRFTTLFVNSVTQGDGTCIRMDMDPLTTTDWINGISSPEMACGVDGDRPVNRTCPLKPGDSISLLHRLWTDGSQPGSIDPSHKGSTAVYMKKLADADSSDPYSAPATGDGWFKLAWNGYDEAAKQWGTETMIANDGKVSTTVPSDLSSGYYLIRSEVLALQNIVDGRVQPQFYAGCAQVYVDGGSGSADTTAQTVSIPGYIDDSTTALSYDIYGDSPPSVPYEEFGPPAYGGSNSVAATKISTVTKRWNRAGYSSGNENENSGRRPASGTRLRWNRPASHQPTTEPNFDLDDPSIDTQSNAVDTSGNENISNDANDNDNYPTEDNSATSSSRGASPATSTKPMAATKTPTVSQGQTSTSSSFIGSCPPDTILTVANQCLVEIPSWTSDTPGSLPKCWAASQTCWDTSSTCWANLSPAINANDQNAGCHLWEAKCNELVKWCEAGNTDGPPNHGTMLGSGNEKRSELGRVRRDLRRHVLRAKRRNMVFA